MRKRSVSGDAATAFVILWPIFAAIALCYVYVLKPVFRWLWQPAAAGAPLPEPRPLVTGDDVRRVFG